MGCEAVYSITYTFHIFINAYVFFGNIYAGYLFNRCREYLIRELLIIPMKNEIKSFRVKIIRCSLLTKS